MVDISNIIKDHTVDIYDSSAPVAKAVLPFEPRKVRLFTRQIIDSTELEGVTVHEHLATSAAALSSADVCMLDGNALKALAVRYPSDAQYLLARITLRSSWILGFAGLVRRLILGRVSLGGVARIKDGDNKSMYWLLINKTRKTVPTEQLLLPKSVGTIAFFEWMRKEQINYIVPRFYEQLPELHREGGDLDLLVEDDHVKKVLSYLKSHSDKITGTSADSIPVGMHSVTRSDGVPYFPPPLARQLLKNAVDGPAGSRIPEKTDALHAFIYHTLYHHKGYATNIPSESKGKPEHPPENDYGAIIQEKASDLGINVGETMEDLDEYMLRVGWRPARDTLAKIGEKNAWVKDRYFCKHDDGSTGLAVFVLKERVLERDLLDEVVNALRVNGLNVIQVRTLSAEEKKRATDEVRGGNWVGTEGHSKGWLPAVVVIAVDPHCANLSGTYGREYERIRVTKRKNQIRDAFDDSSGSSLVHSADNTREAWDYIEACFPDEIDAIRDEVEAASNPSLFARFGRYLSPTYVIHAFRCSLRDFVTHRLL